MKALPKRLLIANRGEIAVRVARTATEMGIEPVAVCAEADAGAFHAGRIGRSVSLGPGSPAETYLSIPRILEAAREAEADAVHPGYGFLSENPAFARAVEDKGLLWIGPPASAIEQMGDKIGARRRAQRAGVPVVPGSDGSESSDDELSRKAAEIGFPLLVKPAAGGGGKGMTLVEEAKRLPEALEEARRVAGAAFGDSRLYLEKLLERPRHVEFQVFGDRHGHVAHLGERECSVQRRHQKIVEETPSPALDETLRAAMGRAAAEMARGIGYVGAGTVEFLLDARRNFYFLEMNTRLQVEHPITEETLGLDLVRAQLEIAAGAQLPPAWRAGEIAPRGHAIEARLYAEDPRTFLPRTGRILAWEAPAGPGVRVDAGVEEGSSVGLDYDPLLAKLILFAEDRESAIARARRALVDWIVLGVETNLPLLSAALASEEFGSGRYATDLVPRLPALATPPVPDAVWIAAALELSAPAARGSDPRSEPWDAGTFWRAGA
jgi:acetyl/propionyl-CoA carboxylase alpha subunit